MYENDNYTNGYTSYQPSQSAPQMPQYQQPEPVKVKKEKKKGGAGRFCRKMLACASMGLCFGLCAGAGVYAVGEGTGLFDKWQAAQEVSGEITNLENFREEIENMVSDGSNHSVVSTNVTSVTSDVSDVVEKVMPAMVSIINNYSEKVSYFGQVMEKDATSTGSGIIVGENDTELLIATNYHVVADAKKLTVHFIDDTDAEAVLKGADPDMDLAVIAVSLNSLSEETHDSITIARLGDSESLKLGEPVIAIGNALGYGQSVTGGYVSALNREVTMEDGSTGTFIQTDAAINPGNSGGALLNINGEVIGINSSKIGGTYVEGIGYAIPISAAQPILEELMTKETRVKVDGAAGYLGIIPQSVTADAAEVYGMPKGVFVSKIEEGTPAAEGGLLRGDIITKLDGSRISTADELREALEYYAPGETVELTVMRNMNGEYEEVVLEITLGSRPESN